MSAAQKAKKKKRCTVVGASDVFGLKERDKKEEPKPDHLQWIVDAAEKLQYCSDGRIRLLAALRFKKYAPEIIDHLPHFAGTLALAAKADSNANVRKAAIDAIGALGSSAGSCADSLENALKNDENKWIRAAAAGALAAVGKENSSFPQVRALRLAVLYDSQPSVRCDAAVALAAFDTAADAVIEDLAREVVADSDPVLRSRALAAFALFGNKSEPYAEMLAGAALNDRAAGVRLAAATTMDALGDIAKAGASQLLAALEHEDPLRRKAAVRALATIGYEAPPTPEPIVDETPKRRGIRGRGSPRKTPRSAGVASSESQPSSKKTSPQKTSSTRAKNKESSVKSSPKKMKEASARDITADDSGALRSKSRTRNSTCKARRFSFADDPPLPPATPPPLARAGVTLAALALQDTDALVRYRAGEALNSFGRQRSALEWEWAQTTLQDDDAEVRKRASEALGASQYDRRLKQAEKFAKLIAGTGDSDGRCGTAEIVTQHRALAAMRDLGTAARPHRSALDAARQGRDPDVCVEARRALVDLEVYPRAQTGRRIVGTPISTADLRRTMADLRSEAAELRMQARCSTAAGQRSEDMFFLRAKLLA